MRTVGFCDICVSLGSHNYQKRLVKRRHSTGDNFLPRIQTSFLQPFPGTAERTIENTGEGEMQSCKEMREVTRRAAFPCEVSHTALAKKQHWPTTQQHLNRMISESSQLKCSPCLNNSPEIINSSLNQN